MKIAIRIVRRKTHNCICSLRSLWQYCKLSQLHIFHFGCTFQIILCSCVCMYLYICVCVCQILHNKLAEVTKKTLKGIHVHFYSCQTTENWIFANTIYLLLRCVPIKFTHSLFRRVSLLEPKLILCLSLFSIFLFRIKSILEFGFV